MDDRFHPAMGAVRADDLVAFRTALEADPGIATARSSCSHPTLLQCVALDGSGTAHNVEMARLLVKAGAAVDVPLVAAASADNAAVAGLLLDHGAAVDGTGGWSPIEEALYWSSRNTLAVLLARGTGVRNLRVAAGLGRTDRLAMFFRRDGSLTPDAGGIDWPFGTLDEIAEANRDEHAKTELAGRVRAWRHDRQSVVDNAFVFACMHGQLASALLLLDLGASINAIPDGFDFAGTGLHYAAMNGHRPMVELLLGRGADPTITDPRVHADAAGWAAHGGQTEIAELLRRFERPPSD